MGKSDHSQSQPQDRPTEVTAAGYRALFGDDDGFTDELARVKRAVADTATVTVRLHEDVREIRVRYEGVGGDDEDRQGET